MAHKVHPKIFRVREVADWNSRWLNRKKLAQYLEEDFRIREFLKKRLEKIGIEKVEIERFPGKLQVYIFTARPGLIIGRGGRGVEELKRGLENALSLSVGKRRELKLEIREIKNPWFSAKLSAQYVAQRIEKRVPYRRVLKYALDKIMAVKGVEGSRIQVAGRLNGTEIARTEWLQRGKLPRQTIRANIDYAKARAFCTYGVIGVKVWIYKGEKI